MTDAARRTLHRCLNASTFARLPHVRMSHQRRPAPRPRSKKNHVQRAHWRTREKSSLRSSCSNPSAATSIQRDAAAPGFPVRIVWGEDDGWIPLEQGQALADRIAHGKLIKVPRAAHLVQEDAPEAIVAAMFDR
ncbi:hypothetical protein WI98_10605 [Burkholderia vietnamiensis]|nr:hypothetical protein WI98_10605 [Burkholderia vietnamiensis]